MKKTLNMIPFLQNCTYVIIYMHRKCECLNAQMSTVVISEWCNYRSFILFSAHLRIYYIEHVFMHNKIISKRY